MKSNSLVIICSKINQIIILTQTEYSLFRTDILSKTGSLKKLTENVVTIPSSFWTR